MSGRLKLTAAIAVALAAASPPLAGALSMRTGEKRTVVSGLEPGRPCPLEKCAGGPLTLENTGTEAATVTLTLALPEKDGLQDGYEAAPSASWVKLGRERLKLEAGKDGRTEGVVTPGKEAEAGGQYQVDWLADAESEGGLKLRLRSRLLLRLDDGDEKKWREERGKEKRRDAEVKLLGDSKRGHKAGLKWANAGERPQTVRVRVGAPREDELPEGYEACPNPAFLKAPRRVRIPAGKVTQAELSPRVPDQARYRRRKWAFEVRTQALEAPEGEEERTIVLLDTREVFAK
jgi:hypothetical protein